MGAKLQLWTSYWLGMKLLASMTWACLASDKKRSVWWKARTRRWSLSWKGKLVSLAGTPSAFQPISYWATKFAKIWQVNEFHSLMFMCISCGVKLLLKHRLFMEDVETGSLFIDWSKTQGNIFCGCCCDVMSQDTASVLLKCSAQSRLPAVLPCLWCVDTGNAL